MPFALWEHRHYQVKTYQVIDGDTIDTEVYEERPPRWLHRIRLHGIDAPEIEQPYGPEAAARLRQLMNDARRIFIKVTKEQDRYGRAVAIVYRDSPEYQTGQFNTVNALMVDEGMAYAAYGDDYREHEARARSNRRGVWAGCQEDQRPWEYRKAQQTPLSPAPKPAIQQVRQTTTISSPAPPPQPPRVLNPVVIDGNRIWATLNGNRQRLHLYGIHSPADGNALERKAAHWLREHLDAPNNDIRAVIIGNNAHGEPLVELRYGSSPRSDSLNASMVRQGIAYAYRDNDRYQAQSRVAQDAGAGMWRHPTPMPTPEASKPPQAASPKPVNYKPLVAAGAILLVALAMAIAGAASCT